MKASGQTNNVSALHEATFVIKKHEESRRECWHKPMNVQMLHWQAGTFKNEMTKCVTLVWTDHTHRVLLLIMV